MTDQNEFTAGFLTKITAAHQSGSQQLVTANYQATGLLADYKTNPTGTFVTTTVTADTLIPSRIGRVQAGALFDTGVYKYDGAGNIKEMGSGDTFRYDTRSRLTSAKYSGQSTPCTDSVAMSQCFSYDRYGNLISKTGVSSIPDSLATSTSTNHLNGGTYDDRGNLKTFGTDIMTYDLLNRQYRTQNSSPTADFVYFYDGAGERIAKLDRLATAQRREIARDMIEARGDTLGSCVPNPFTDVVCSANPNDGKYIQKFKDVGITAGCGGGAFCPNDSITREQAAVFFVKGTHCAVNGSACSYTPPACTGIFTDVPCPSQYANWIEQLYNDGITGGCVASPLQYCPSADLKVWEMMAWMQNVDDNPTSLPDWRGYNPLPRASIVTFRDGSQLTTEAQFTPPNPPSGDASAIFNYTRENHFLGRQLISTTIWSGTPPTTPGWHYYSSDHLGSPRLVTGPAGTEVEERKFWPYGDPGPLTGSESGQRLKLALMEKDDESSHYYDHARYEGHTIGRFLAPDPIFGGPGNPQSWNRYAYVLGSPITLIDPTGLEQAYWCDGPCPWLVSFLDVFGLPSGFGSGPGRSMDRPFRGHGWVAPKSPKPTQSVPCPALPSTGEHGFGAGVSVSGAAETGAQGAAAASASVGAGVFVEPSRVLPTGGAFVDTGAFVGRGTEGPSFPGRSGYSDVQGGVIGGGVNFFITNAGNVSQIGDAFHVSNYILAFDRYSASLQVATSDGTWQISVGISPMKGGGFGVSSSQYDTCTITSPTNSSSGPF